jgi:Lar family restriction alleviation protein
MNPCPFCEDTKSFVSGSDWNGWYVVCAECGADGPTETTKAGAIDAWNTRAEWTCHDLGGCDEAGMQVFHCSECGCVLSLFDVSGTNTLCTNHIYDYPRYCPNCGAKVVGE